MQTRWHVVRKERLSLLWNAINGETRDCMHRVAHYWNAMLNRESIGDYDIWWLSAIHYSKGIAFAFGSRGGIWNKWSQIFSASRYQWFKCEIQNRKLWKEDIQFSEVLLRRNNISWIGTAWSNITQCRSTLHYMPFSNWHQTHTCLPWQMALQSIQT